MSNTTTHWSRQACMFCTGHVWRCYVITKEGTFDRYLEDGYFVSPIVDWPPPPEGETAERQTKTVHVIDECCSCGAIVS